MRRTSAVGFKGTHRFDRFLSRSVKATATNPSSQRHEEDKSQREAAIRKAGETHSIDGLSQVEEFIHKLKALQRSQALETEKIQVIRRPRSFVDVVLSNCLSSKP